MAAIEVTVNGVLYDKTARTTQPVVLIGEISLTGLGVGGGPMPPGQGGGGGTPPGIWGGGPHPTPPIGYPPGQGPIIDPGPKPPEPIQPPIEWKAVWHPTEGWLVVGVPTGEHVTPSK